MRRVLIASLLAASVLYAAPAAAESGTKAKPVGDAPAAIDITGIEADNGQRRVRVKLVVPGLTDAGTFTFGYEGRHYDGMAIIVRKRADGITKKAFHCGEDSCRKVACRGIRVRWSVLEHFVSASVPQSCYPLEVPDEWSFNGHADLGKDYDSEGTSLRLARG